MKVNSIPLITLTYADIEAKLLEIHQQRSTASNSGLVQSIRAEIGYDMTKNTGKLQKEFDNLKKQQTLLNNATEAKLQTIITAMKEYQLSLQQELQIIKAKQ